MADQEDQNQASGEVMDSEPAPAQANETEEQVAAGDESNNQGEEQPEETPAKDGDDQVVDTEQTQESLSENPSAEVQETEAEKVEEAPTIEATEVSKEAEVDKEEEAGEKEAEKDVEADTVEATEAEKVEEAGADKVEAPEAEKVDEAEADKVDEAEADKVDEAEADKVDEAEANKVDEAEADKVDEAEADKVGEAEADKVDEAEADKVDEAEADKVDEAQADKVDEAEADKVKDVEEGAGEKDGEQDQVPAEKTDEGKTDDNQNADVNPSEEQKDDEAETVEALAGEEAQEPVEEQDAKKEEDEEKPVTEEEKPVTAEEPQADDGADTTVIAEGAEPPTDSAPVEETDDVQLKQEEEEADIQQEETKDEQQQEQPEAEGASEPVQVETSVAEGPPGSPKIPMEEGKKQVNLEATATVKFVLMPSGQVVTLACTLGQTLDSLKAHFAVELKMSTGLIMIMFDGRNMPDSTTLADLGVGPNGTVQLEMQSADPVNTPLKPYRPRQEYHMPDVITVRVMTEDGEAKDVVVEIERSRVKKSFLGGFRNKNSGKEFHNAAAQTVKKPRPPPTVERFCRDTQTCEQKNTRQQTTNTTSTQMTGVGVFISDAEDKLVTPGKYFSADDHWALILRNVIILQKYYRRWLAKRYVTKLKEDKAKRLEWERQEELRKKREKEERIKRDYARRLNPKTKADFDMLLNCLEKWRQEEMERINTTLTGAERKAALCMLLDQETELLSAIERHKNDANKDNRDNRIIAFLEKAAAPKKWQGHDGNLTYMDTPFTIRAKELRDIYNSINMKYLTQDERLDVLLTLKHTVKEHDCKLTQEIIELIDREADLLMRGVKEGNLTGLRKRISTLFLQYIKTPTFNPEAARLLKVPQDPSTLRKNINYCHSCGRYLPSTEFFLTSNSKQVGRCRNCMKVENDGRQREDYTFYRVMLKSLRKSEEAMQDGSSICYLLQENDLRYLVENIWSNQSVLSAWDDLYDLVLVRWDKHQEWSPWNCILLTHDEAEAHQKLFSLEEGYGHVFIHKVTQKHNFARNYFSRLPGMAELLRQKVGNRELVNNNNGPAVSGHTVAKAQKC